MIYLKDDTGLEMRLTPKQKVDSNDLKRLLVQESPPAYLTTNVKEVNKQLDILNFPRNREYNEDYLEMLNKERLCSSRVTGFQYDEEEPGKFSIMSELEPMVATMADGRQFSTYQLYLLDSIKEKEIVWRYNHYLIHLDYQRLLDWLAFDVSHVDYDPDNFSLEAVKNHLGHCGEMFSATPDKIESLIPKDYEAKVKELDLAVDFDTESLLKNSKQRKAYNYFRQEFKCPMRKGRRGLLFYEDLLSYQDDYALMAIYKQIDIFSHYLGARIRLMAIGNGIIDFYIQKKQPAVDTLLNEIMNYGIKVRLFDCHSFIFKPKMTVEWVQWA